MPKCKNCQYLTNTGGYEYPEYTCKIFGDEVPEKYQIKDDDGCKCTQKFLKKRSDEYDKAEEEHWKMYDDINKFYGALADIKMLVKVIKEQTPIADEKYLKEYHNNLIQKKCELKIPTETLYAIINYCISWILEEYNDPTYPATPERWNKEQIDWYKLLDLKKEND